MAAALSIVNRPSFIPVGSALAASLSSNETQYILSYEHACYDSDKGPTFLATKGVFTCISVFAWSPSKKAFAAHIPLNQVHHNIRHGHIINTLPEITEALAWTFKHEEDPAAVKVHIVGGQKEQDANQDLALRFESPLLHRFSWHVILAVRAAGLTVDGDSTRLLNVFEGIPYSIVFEQQQRAKGHSFSLVALDRNTGALITHTLVESVGDYRIAALGLRDMAECVRYREAFKRPWAVPGRSSVRVFSVHV